MSKNLPPSLPNMQQQLDVSIYTSHGQRKVPDIRTPARQKAVNFENKVRHAPVENGAFFRADGTLITQKAGTINSIHFDQHELVGTGKSLFTHNHPNGLSFSCPDVEQAVEIDLIELRVVTTYCRYILQPNGSWPSWPTIESAIQQHGPHAHQFVTAMVHSCQLANGDVRKEMQHQLWLLVAHDLNLIYSREPS